MSSVSDYTDSISVCVPKVGSRITKMFKDEDTDVASLYRGSITSIEPDDDGNDLYHIVYDDGDEEDLDLRECGCACVLHIKTQDSQNSDSDSSD